MNPKNLKNWLNHPDRKGVVSITELEKRLGCSRSTLNQWLSGKRQLPQKWEQPLIEQLKKLTL